MKSKDLETRDRLLKSAAQLFADRGFKKVTVRDICRAAKANVASVNYHFGDKTGLYREVLQQADTRKSDKVDVIMKAEIDRLRAELYVILLFLKNIFVV